MRLIFVPTPETLDTDTRTIATEPTVNSPATTIVDPPSTFSIVVSVKVALCASTDNAVGALLLGRSTMPPKYDDVTEN